MTVCNKCGGRMIVGPSTFPGFDLMACEACGRPIRLIVKNAPRPSSRPLSRRDTNRALRAARRAKMRRATP